MRIDRAQALAAAWVRGHDFGLLPVVGSFFTGSTLEGRGADLLAPESDVDVAVVVDGPAPPKLGKLRYQGVRVEVTYLSWAELADPERVARTSYLAPSFAHDALVTDPDGRLDRLRRHVAPLFARPDVVRDRCAAVLDRMAAPPEPAGSWPLAVTGWLFGTSLATVVLLVAGLRNPTVRLRYLRARELLESRGLGGRYPELLAQLGCLEVTPEQVLDHVPPLAAAFDATAACGPTGFPFASDLSPDSRPVAVDGTLRLVEQGDHREAVFWLVATFSRCLQVLDATGAADRQRHHDAFAAAVTGLTGLPGPEALARRRAQVVASLPGLRALAWQLIDR